MLTAARSLGSLAAPTGLASRWALAACAGPFTLGGARPHSDVRAQDVDDEVSQVDAAWWREVVGDGSGSSSGDGSRGGWQPRWLDAPVDAPRYLRDYQRMMLTLTQRRR